MDKENEEYLRKHYSSLFERYLYRRHIDCYDGWYSTIEHMLYMLSCLDKPVNIIQIKQKFACLTVYAQPRIPEAECIIDAACKRAETTCEICGGYISGPSVYDNYRWTAHEKCLDKRKWISKEYYEHFFYDRPLLELVDYDENQGWQYY